MLDTKESIFESVKKQIGINSLYDDHFDDDIIMNINTVFMTYHQMGVDRLPTAFKITGPSEAWSDYLDDNQDIEGIKTLTFLKVKKIFDPTASSSISQAYDEMIKELEWRIYTQQDGFNA